MQFPCDRTTNCKDVKIETVTVEPIKIQSIKCNGIIWSVVVSNASDELVLDVRDTEKRTIEYTRLDLRSFELSPLVSKGLFWKSTIETYDGNLFIAEYRDGNDPSNQLFFKLKDGIREEINEEDIPYKKVAIQYPFLYGQGSDHFKTVCEYLGLALPLSCEYMETGGKIILSYYLRSANGFDRYLLLLENGEKVWKELQDSGTKGFASGAFFVLDNNLFFVKNKNEICTYPL